MTDIRQSPPFARFMQDLGWQVITLCSTEIYSRKFPLIGHFAKIPRPSLPIPFEQLDGLRKKYRIFRLKIAPFVQVDNKNTFQTKQLLTKYKFKVENYPFNPTTTIQIGLTQPEKNIFDQFSEAKRRGVRRAIKNGVIVKESKDFESFIGLRKKQYSPMGFLFVNEMRQLWKNFYPKHAILLLAYPTIQSPPLTPMHAIAFIGVNKPLAGILLLYYDNVAYYWYASALKIGKKLFAPTLLVWEALKLAKKRGCQIFDFEGICDERFPKASSSWKGFTKFKEGFGGKKVIFMENFKG